MTLLPLALSSCAGAEHTDTQLFFDTAVTITAETDEETLSDAFLLCAIYEDRLSATKKESEISYINTGGKYKVSSKTAELISKGLYYGELSGGKFDITVYPLSRLWDTKNEVVPSRDEIAEALKNIDYQSVTVEGDMVSAGGKQIDLGGIAKGYVADTVRTYLYNMGAKKGIINLGGNVVVFGDKEYNVGIKKPFSDNELSATVKVKNKSVVTSGVYERCFKKDGKLYHHILDTETGYPVESDLWSATIINDTSVDGDALSTICMCLGKEKATELIENTANTEAVFIDNTGKVTYTSGIKTDGKYLTLK